MTFPVHACGPCSILTLSAVADCGWLNIKPRWTLDADWKGCYDTTLTENIVLARSMPDVQTLITAISRQDFSSE